MNNTRDHLVAQSTWSVDAWWWVHHVLKRVKELEKKHPTYLAKPDGGRFILRSFSIYMLLLRQWEFPSYSFGLVVQGQSSPSRPTPFPCMDVPMIISFKTSVVFLALLDHRAALRCTFCVACSWRVRPFWGPMDIQFAPYTILVVRDAIASLTICF
jgi:hypothetical protein